MTRRTFSPVPQAWIAQYLSLDWLYRGFGRVLRSEVRHRTTVEALEASMTTPGYESGQQSGQQPGYGGAYASAPGYPVKYHVEYPEKLSRGLIFVKWLLVIPHIIVLYFLGIASFVVTFIAWFAILFTGKYPRGMFDFNVGVQRWSNRVQAYFMLMRDEYPPFTLQDQ
jgi:hypothetical protein